MAGRFPHRSARWLTPLAVAFLLVPAFGQEVRKFSPEIEQKLGEYMAKLREVKSKDEAAQLKKETAEIAKVTGLDDAGQKALEEPASAAVASAVGDWLKKIDTLYRTTWSGEISVEMLDQWITQVSSIARNGYGLNYEKAANQKGWRDALDRTLDAKQTAAWKAVVDEQQRKFDEQCKGVLAATQARIREQGAQVILGTVSTLTGTLSLDEERAKKLRKLAEQAAEKAADSVKEKARKMLFNTDEIRRKQIAKTNNFYIAPEEEDAPEKHEIWREGFKQILTPEEVQKWEAAIARRRENRVQAMTKVLVWTLDQTVAFTASQREQLAPLAAELVRKQKRFFAEYPSNDYYNINLQSFTEAAAQAKEEDLKKILDAKQVQHWKDTSTPQTRKPRTAVKQVVNATPAKAGAKPAPFEPEELEVAISDYLYDLASREQELAVADALLQAEDAIRVAGVEGKAVDRLQTAARGAMEEDFQSWTTNTATSVRSQMQNATPADVQQRAANADYSSSRRRKTARNKDPKGVWEKTVAQELSDAQRAAWQKEIDARNAYEQQTTVASVLTATDQLCVLSTEQWSKLDSVLAKQLDDYGPEFAQMFSNRGNVWFLQSYYALTPLAGIPEKEMRKILSDEQWKRLTSANQFSNALNYWENIESNHKQRVKPPKE